MFANFYDRNEVTILLFEKQKNTENEKIAADYYLIEQIQPQGGITFNDERYIQTGNSYECCLHIYELPEKVNDNWLKELTDIKDTVVTIDISSHDIYEIKKNINRSIQEQASRRGSATNWEEAYNAEKKANDMIQLFHEISKLKEVVKIIDIRIFISDREKEKLEEKISKLSKILESNKYRSAIFLNEAKNEWVSMYQTYTEQQKNPYSIFGQSIQGETLAHGNPFHFSSLEDPYGSYLGYTKCGGNVLFDEFTKTKTRLYYNSLVIGGMGSGKSTFLKKRFKDRASRGDFVRVFDITGEFSRLTKYYGGKIIKFGSSNTMLNPFEILRAGDNETINFQLHMSKLSANYKYLVPTATEQEVIMFSNIARELYQEFNLYSDVDGKENQITGLLPEKYPTYTDYLNLLNRKITEISNGNYNEINIEVARRNLITLDNIKNTIEHVIYTFGSILDGYTTIENILDEQIICYDISDLKQMKAEIFDVVIFNVISLCWDNCVANGIRMNQMEYEGKIEKWDKVKTLILIDEAHHWVNTKKEHALDLVTKYLREARKYNGGITLASQSIRDFVPEGGTGVAIDKIKTVFELTQYKFIFNQDTNVIDLINNVFKNSLTERQINKIPRLELGNCILHISGDKNYEFHVHVTDEEQRLFAGGD